MREVTMMEWLKHRMRMTQGWCLGPRWMRRRESHDAENAAEVALTEMRSGETGTVVRITGGPGVTRRLETLGVKPGTMITKVASQMLRGPVTFRVGASQYAIGFGMARKVIVRR